MINADFVESVIYEQTGANNGALRQGEIISELVQPLISFESIDGETAQATLATYDFVIVLTQDCDLEWDFKARFEKSGSQQKLLLGVLFCNVFPATEFKARAANSKEQQWMLSNRVERYHYLQKAESKYDAQGEGLPELGVDFKQYFTLPPDQVYSQVDRGQARRRCRLVNEYLHHFTSRFFFFQRRVALPSPHESD